MSPIKLIHLLNHKLFIPGVLKVLNRHMAQLHIRLLSGLLTLAADIILLIAQTHAAGTANIQNLLGQFTKLTTDDQTVLNSLAVENIEDGMKSWHYRRFNSISLNNFKNIEEGTTSEICSFKLAHPLWCSWKLPGYIIFNFCTIPCI